MKDELMDRNAGWLLEGEVVICSFVYNFAVVTKVGLNSICLFEIDADFPSTLIYKSGKDSMGKSLKLCLPGSQQNMVSSVGGLFFRMKNRIFF